MEKTSPGLDLLSHILQRDSYGLFFLTQGDYFCASSQDIDGQHKKNLEYHTQIVIKPVCVFFLQVCTEMK